MKETQINWPVVKLKMETLGFANIKELAEAAGLHENTLYRVGVLNTGTIDKLAQALKCTSLDILVYGEYKQRTRRPHKPRRPAPAAAAEATGSE
jgi:DNA-binding Xre family transcriptional regulator